MEKIKKLLPGVLFFLPVVLLGLAGSALAATDVASLPVNLGVANITGVLYAIAFIGGALMILTPCSAATIPAYFAVAFGDKAGGSKSKITQRTAVFFLGFAVVYAFMGGGASLIGRWLNIYQEQLAIIVGALLIIFGVLVLIGKSFFSFSAVTKVKTKKTTKGTFTFGSLFAIGFSGCAGPVLAGILTIASGLPTTQAVLLMFFYSLGMGVPLLILSLLFDKYNILQTKFFQWSKEFKILGRTVYLSLPNIISGVLLLALGVVFLVFRSTSALNATFPRAVTDIGYSLQDWLLALNLPPYIDVIVFVIVGFALIKLLAKIFSASTIDSWRLSIDFNKAKFVLIIITVVLFSFNQLLFFTKQAGIKQKIAAATEAARPAELEVTIITDSSCEECFDITDSIRSLKSQNVKILTEQTVDWKSEEGQRLIQELGIEQVPNLVISGELNKDQTVQSLLSRAGVIQDNVFFLAKVPPPYVDIQSGEVKGIFEVVLLIDKSCGECYDTANHKVALKNLGMTVSSERTVDISSAEGRKLLTQYQITAVPTLLLTGDLGEYAALAQVWPQVGTIEEDGTYVFRQVKIMGTYRDLATGKVVAAPSRPPAASSDNTTPAVPSKNAN